MNDFLARLATRALSPQPALRPRVPSVYEPVSAPAFDLSAGLEQHAEILAPDPAPRTNRDAQREAPKILTSSPELSHPHLPPPSGPVATTIPTAHRDVQEPRERNDLVQTSGPRSSSRAHETIATRVPANATIEQDVPPRSEKSTLQTTEHRETPAPTPTAPLPSRNNSSHREAAVGQDAPAERPAPKKSPRPNMVREIGLQNPLPPPPGPRALPLASTPALPSRREAPTVHVSIGRVEIRAVTPPATPGRPPTAPTPRLSLDDYLKQNGGGPR